MLKFHVWASYATRAGRVGHWSATIEADGASDALLQGHVALRRLRPFASKVDMHARLIP